FLAGLTGDDPRGLRLAAGGGVAMESAARGSLVDPAHELAMLLVDLRLVPAVDRSPQALRQRLDGRAVAEVLQPLPRCEPDALLLLLDVRHSVKTPAARAPGS